MDATLSSLLRIVASGIRAREQEIDLISHNIANLQTTGYKRFQAITESVALPLPKEGGEGWEWQPEGTRLAATRRVVLQGAIEPTERAWDLALDGPGYFQVQLSDGTIAYTRDGAFRLDAEGRLVTADGKLVLPPITIPADAREVYVDRDGAVLVQVNGQVQQVGAIQIARFSNPAGLQAIGGSYYIATAASGPAQVAQAGSPGYAEIVSRALETSNVDLSTEMVSLLITQRAYGVSLRALQMVNRMYELAVEIQA
ncbi:MAG: flagellar hook-basal body complex protein [Chloroflexi bacterium]|nr:flagellar hook-basal body complex protein [Chloroflexota bacterium]